MVYRDTRNTDTSAARAERLAKRVSDLLVENAALRQRVNEALEALAAATDRRAALRTWGFRVGLGLLLAVGALSSWASCEAAAVEETARCRRVCRIQQMRFEWVDDGRVGPNLCVCSGDRALRLFGMDGQPAGQQR